MSKSSSWLGSALGSGISVQKSLLMPIFLLLLLQFVTYSDGLDGKVEPPKKVRCYRCLSIDCPLIATNQTDCSEVRSEMIALLLGKNSTLPPCPSDDIGWVKLALNQATADCASSKPEPCTACGRIRVKGLLTTTQDDLLPKDIVFARILTCLTPPQTIDLSSAEGGCLSRSHQLSEDLRITAEQCLDKDICKEEYCTKGWGLSSRFAMYGPGGQPPKWLPTIVLILILIFIIIGAIVSLCGSLIYKAQAAR